MKNKPAKILDVPTIQKEVHDKHQMFIKKYGGAIDKVMADHQLFNDIVTAKLSRILVIFKQETAIDDFNIANNGPYTRITLTKKNYDTYIEIETNGSQIVLKGYTYTSDFSSDFEIIKKKFYGVSDESFDWVDFSKELIDYIHKTIYERKEVMEQQVKGILDSNN